MLRPHTATSPRAGRLLALVAALVVLAPAAASAGTIEDYATYDPQATCSPAAKPGTVKLSTWLQQQYPGSGSLGISRSCADGGVSEHKEGRAFDWAVDVGSARDRGYVADLVRRLLATDAEGNPAALARRMGIMYFIWDDHMYAAYRQFQPRDYLGCPVLATCSATLRHRNHVHLSLSRAGGAGTTSWYTGGTTVPPLPTTPPPTLPTPPTPPTPTTPTPVPAFPTTADGVLDLSRRPYVTLPVRSDGRLVTTGFTLRRGTSYVVTAAGSYGYGGPTQVADASCRWAPVRRTWVPTPTATAARTHGSLDLLVAGRAVSGPVCRTDHVYTRTIRPGVTGPLRLRVANTPLAATGALTVLVSGLGTDVRAGLPATPTDPVG